jgi:hypothetical protein
MCQKIFLAASAQNFLAKMSGQALCSHTPHADFAPAVDDTHAHRKRFQYQAIEILVQERSHSAGPRDTAGKSANQRPLKVRKRRTKRDVCCAGRIRNRCARFKLALVVHLWIFAGIPVLLGHRLEGKLRLYVYVDLPRQSERKFMSNQVGDVYSCSDPNCGCEVQIQRPCSMSASGGSSSKTSRGGTSDTTEAGSSAPAFQGSTNAARTEAISTPADYGDQGASGEGMFGTAGSGRSATTSGRYDTGSTRPLAGGSDVSTRPSDPQTASSGSMTCFCGSPMRVAQSSTQSVLTAGR